MGLMEDFTSQVPFIGVVVALFLYTIKALRDQQSSADARHQEDMQIAREQFKSELKAVHSSCHVQQDRREEAYAGLTKRVIGELSQMRSDNRTEMEERRKDDREVMQQVLKTLRVASGGD